MNFVHLLPVVFIGLCPICLLCIVLSALLLLILVRRLFWTKNRKKARPMLEENL